LHEDDSSSDVVIGFALRGELKDADIISVKNVEDNWRCIIQARELNVKVLRFIVQRIIRLLNRMGFNNILPRSPNLDVRV
jgi:hypothetical protein